MIRRLATPAAALVIGGLTLALFGLALLLTGDVSHGASSFAADPIALAFTPIGLVVAYKRPENPIGWSLLFAGLFAEMEVAGSLYAIAVYRNHHHLPLGPVAVLFQLGWAPAIVLFGVAIQLFPSGRVPAGRWRWAFWGYVGFGVAWAVGAVAIALAAIVHHTVAIISSGDLYQIDHPTGPAVVWGWMQTLFFPALGVVLLLWLARELPAYRRSGGEHRQQLKWVIAGATLSAVGGFLLVAWSNATGWEAQLGHIGALGLLALPICLGIAVLRFKLYEIDRLVSRTLAYAIVTGLLVGVFVGLVVLTTQVLPFSSPVGVAASTLVAAALFNPLRLRVQRIVDRRFNRARYDAEATVEALARRLREAVDVETVEASLAAAVDGAVQPTSLNVWLKEA